jgi:hypothetical protein
LFKFIDINPRYYVPARSFFHQRGAHHTGDDIGSTESRVICRDLQPCPRRACQTGGEDVGAPARWGTAHVREHDVGGGDCRDCRLRRAGRVAADGADSSPVREAGNEDQGRGEPTTN